MIPTIIVYIIICSVVALILSITYDRPSIMWNTMLGVAAYLFLFWLVSLTPWYDFPEDKSAQIVYVENPCEEDEALVWLDAPTKSICIPLDNIR